ncbi:MAG: glycosyltransferase [Oscillospiraceae bacterium]|nr:glycosyltransferase [Oscillospiraceae bacterium]
MDQLNVCLINDSFPPAIDGVANAVTNYADVITRSYGRATVITPYYPDADDGAFAFPVLRYPSVDTTKLVGYRAGMPFSPELLRKAEEAGFDIIHSHCPITSTMLARALRDRIRVPVVFTYHTKFDIDIANAVRSKRLQEEAARLLVENISACDEVWTVSRGAGDNLRKLGYTGDYRVMPNGVDFPQGRVEQALVDEVTEGFDLPEGLPVFLFVGRMMWYKGLRIILDALAELDRQGRDFRMVFVGAGNDKDEVMAYAHSLGLDGKALFSEPIRDRNRIRAWYCRADLFLFPSTFDTNGLVVREAAACGLASMLVVGSCAAEDVTDGENGFLIEENAQSMAAALVTLLDQREAMRRVGECAQRTIYISWESAVSNAYARYFDVIDNFRRGLYPEHDRLSDDFFHGMAAAMELRSQRKEAERRLRQEFQNNYEELRADIAAGRQKWNARLTEYFQYMDRFL